MKAGRKPRNGMPAGGGDCTRYGAIQRRPRNATAIVQAILVLRHVEANRDAKWLIYETPEAFGYTYGADRVHRQLGRDGSTRQHPRHTPAPDLVNRNFTSGGPNQLLVADDWALTFLSPWSKDDALLDYEPVMPGSNWSFR